MNINPRLLLPSRANKPTFAGLSVRAKSRSNRSVLWKAVGRCLAGGMVFAVTSASWANTIYTYTPVNGASDTFSSSTDFSPGAPVSSTTTELTLVGSNTTVLASGLTDTLTDNDTGAFSLNALDLQGTGPAAGGTAAVITLASSAVGNSLSFAGSGPLINLNALAGSVGLTYNVSAPLTLTNGTTFQGNGTATFNFSGAINGGGSLTKAGTSVLTLSGTNTYTGVTTDNAGTISLTGSLSGTSITTNTASVFTESSSGSIAGAGAIFYQNSTGTTTLGGTNTFTGATTLLQGTMLLTGSMTGSSITGNNLAVFTESGTGTIGGSGVTFTQNGGGTLTLAGANTFTGTTTVAAGTVLLDFSQSGSPTNNVLKSGEAVTLGSSSIAASPTGTVIQGTPVLSIKGGAGLTDSQTLGAITFNAATASVLTVAQNGATAVNLTLGSLTRNAQSTVDITFPTSGTVTTTSTGSASGGLLVSASTNGTAYATANGGTTYVANTGGTLSPYTGYATGTANYTTGNNVDVTNGDAPASGSTVNTLRFNTAADTLTLTGANTISAGGILVTPSGTGSVITGGGTIQSGANQEVVIHDYSSVNVADVIADNGTATALTITGPGTTTLSVAPTNTGTTTVNGGTLALANPATSGGTNYTFTNFADAGNLTLGGVAGNAANFIDNSATANTYISGVISGAGNITKNGAGTLNLYGLSGGYTGSVDVEGGTIQLSGASINGVAPQAGLYTSGTLTVNGSGIFSSINGTNNPTSAFSYLTGNGTLASQINRFITINYNGTGSDAFTGTFGSGTTGTSFAKDGLGTIDLTGATLPLNASGFGANTSQLNMNGGTLKASSLAYFTTLQATNGTILLAPTASGAVLSGNTGNANVLTTGLSTFSIVPNEPAGSTGQPLTATIEATGTSNSAREHGGTISLDLGNASALTLAIGNSGYTGSNTPITLDVLNNAHGQLFLIEPGSAVSGTTGINALGGAIKIVEITGGGTRSDDFGLVTNGMVDGGIIGQNNDANRTGTFLTYSGTHVAGDTGFIPVTFDETTTTSTTNSSGAASAFVGGTTTNAQKEHVTATGTVALTAATTNVFALQNDGAAITIPTSGTLSIANTNTVRAGLILNGGSISGGTLNLSTAGGAIYVSGANGSISSNLTGGTFTLQGPGVLSFSGSTVASNQGVSINGSTFERQTAATTVGSTTTLAFADAGLQQITLVNGVFQSYSSTGTTTGFTRFTGFQSNNVYMSQTAGASGGFAARGGPFNVDLGGSFNTTTGAVTGGQFLIWGATSQFTADNAQMTFGSPTANNVVTFANPLSLGGSTPNYTRIINTINGAGGDMTVFSGVITTGSNGTSTVNGTDGTLNILAHTGAGILSLTGNNLYTGGTLSNQGTLLASNPVTGTGSTTTGSAFGTGPVSITGGTLGGTGRIAGATTIGTAGTITGGTVGAVGMLTLASNLTLNGTYLADVTATTQDNLLISGTLTLGATSTLTVNGTPTGSTVDLANYASESGTFATTNLPSGYSLSYGATELDLVQAVPEPSTWVGGLMLVGLIGYTQRRRLGVAS